MAYYFGMTEKRMSTETKVSLLKDEYLLIQKQYEDFDGRIITIKGWSATLGLASLGAGFQYTKNLWLVAAGISAIFWILEAIWKTFQYCYEDRIELLEEAFRSEDFDAIHPLQIYTAWFEVFQKTGYLKAVGRNMKLLLVFFPHIVTVVAGPTIYLLNLYFHFQCK
jgi:hypothetical protein